MLTSKPTGKGPLGKFKRRWEGNIRIHLKEIDVNTRNAFDSAQDMDYRNAPVSTALNPWIL
jgi:hypothetical protein